jgi:predicted nucleotidyltransferase
MLIQRVIAALNQWKVPHALVGGYAVALHGAVRGTVDIDLVLRLNEKDFTLAEEALRSIGLESRLPLRSADLIAYRDEYIANRNLLAWSFYNPKAPIEVVDILLTEDLSTLKTVSIAMGRLILNVVDIADLIAMKKKANRPQDRADIDALTKILQERKSKLK